MLAGHPTWSTTGSTWTDIRRLDELPDGGGTLGKGMLLASTALLLDRHGLTAGARPLMEEVINLGVPLPAVMEEATSFFWRTGQAQEAHYAFLMADVLAPRWPRQALEAIPEEQRGRYAPWVIRAALATPRGDGYLVGAMRGMLQDDLGAEAAAVAAASMRSPRTEWPRDEAVELTLERLVDYARERGVDYEEVLPARELEFQPLEVLGQPPTTVRLATSRTLLACVVEGAIVIGKSNLLRMGDRLLYDTQGDELVGHHVDMRVDVAVASVDQNVALAIGPRNVDGIPCVPEAIWLVGVHSAEFGHWMMEFVPKLLALWDRPGFQDVPIVIDKRMHPQQLESLQLLLGREPRTISLDPGEHLRVERLWVASQVVYLPVNPTDRVTPPTPIDGDGFARLLRRLDDPICQAEVRHGQ